MRTDIDIDDHVQQCNQARYAGCHQRVGLSAINAMYLLIIIVIMFFVASKKFYLRVI